MNAERAICCGYVNMVQVSEPVVKLFKQRLSLTLKGDLLASADGNFTVCASFKWSTIFNKMSESKIIIDSSNM